MGAKQSTGSTPRVRTYSGSGSGASSGAGPHVALGNSHGSSGGRLRTRSLVTYPTSGSSGLHIPVNGGAVGGNTGSDSSSPEENSPVNHLPIGLRTLTHSLPVHLFALHGIKCPVCSKFIPPDDIECHLVVCLTKPRITYNEDVLTEDKGECVICLEDLEQGDTIARLPCLCIYHKGATVKTLTPSGSVNDPMHCCPRPPASGNSASGHPQHLAGDSFDCCTERCIDKWFEKNRSCPEHPQD